MENTLFLQYIKEQPQLWKTIWERKDSITEEFRERFSEYNADRVICIGSGSSHYATHLARPIMEEALGVEVTCVVPSDIAMLRNIRSKRPLYFAVSQGGQSSNTHRLICDLKEKGAYVVGVTEHPASPVAKACDIVLPLMIGEERMGPKTKGVTATALTLIAAAASVSKKDGFDNNLEALICQVSECITEDYDVCKEWAKTRFGDTADRTSLILLGDANSFHGVIREGTLKLLETNHMAVFGYSFDEYLHGVQCAINTDTYFLIVMPKEGSEKVRMQIFIDYLKAKGIRFGILSMDGGNEDHTLHLTPIESNELCSFSYLAALQILSGVWASERGIDLTADAVPGFPQLESKLGPDFE